MVNKITEKLFNLSLCPLCLCGEPDHPEGGKNRTPKLEFSRLTTKPEYLQLKQL